MDGRARILDAAADRFAAAGLEQVVGAVAGVCDVAAAAGVASTEARVPSLLIAAKASPSVEAFNTYAVEAFEATFTGTDGHIYATTTPSLPIRVTFAAWSGTVPPQGPSAPAPLLYAAGRCSSPSWRRTLVEGVLDGTQALALTAERLKRLGDLPLSWDAQRAPLG